jgi:hypothetical protein
VCRSGYKNEVKNHAAVQDWEVLYWIRQKLKTKRCLTNKINARVNGGQSAKQSLDLKRQKNCSIKF